MFMKRWIVSCCHAQRDVANKDRSFNAVQLRRCCMRVLWSGRMQQVHVPTAQVVMAAMWVRTAMRTHIVTVRKFESTDVQLFALTGINARWNRLKTKLSTCKHLHVSFILVLVFWQRRITACRDIELGRARWNWHCELLWLSNDSWLNCACLVVITFYVEVTNAEEYLEDIAFNIACPWCSTLLRNVGIVRHGLTSQSIWMSNSNSAINSRLSLPNVINIRILWWWHCGPVETCRRFGGTYCIHCVLLPWRSRQYVPPKRQ
jgi:hypothetical protein